MIYRLLHKLFGWDYIVRPRSGVIFRVRVDMVGNIWISHWFLGSSTETLTGDDLKDFIWPMCRPEKYIKLSEQKKAGVL